MVIDEKDAHGGNSDSEEIFEARKSRLPKRPAAFDQGIGATEADILQERLIHGQQGAALAVDDVPAPRLGARGGQTIPNARLAGGG